MKVFSFFSILFVIVQYEFNHMQYPFGGYFDNPFGYPAFTIADRTTAEHNLGGRNYLTLCFN
ncbi:hypothetical protein D3C86_941710 [compost metagenome]